VRRGLLLIWLGATAVVSGIVGVISYEAGWAAGLAAKLPAGAVVPYYAPHFFGFGFFGLLPLLFLVLVLLLVFRGGRRWGRGAWGPWGGGYGRFPSATQPPAGDPWRDWPQRPPSEQAPPGQPQG
jgi:hypothetical protein